MPIELKVPSVGESITEVEIGDWLKRQGDRVEKDQNVVVIETEKATVELPAPASGKITKILKQTGESARVGDVIGVMEEGAGREIGSEGRASARPPAEMKEGAGEQPVERRREQPVPKTKAPSQPGPPKESPEAKSGAPEPGPSPKSDVRQTPAAKRALRPEEVKPTGPGERLPKDDVLPPAEAIVPRSQASERAEETVRMSLWRRTIARRLVQAKRDAALLTTFNEIDMSAVSELRKRYGEAFRTKHNAKLGLMSFFVKAAADALNQIPQVNAEVRDENIIYHNYCDIGIAVGTGEGLVVPVLHHAERLSFADIEIAIADFAKRAEERTLQPEELEGGTFTITNGGVFGSLLSTPIVNPPQSAILGLHAIQDRPVVREGQVVIRPMMYVALTYDHRIIDGREAVLFLRRVKETIENPARILLEV